ncbi:MAG: sulfite exporter TauE/SafE family protein [bacterium]
MENQTTKKYKFHVQGMHCNACTLLIESELKDLSNVSSVESSLNDCSVEIEGNFDDKTNEQIAEELTLPLKAHRYSVSVEKPIKEKKWSDFKIAIPIALGFAVVFVILQKLGLVNLVNAGNVTYGTAFVIGIIASLSTCMAVVGGLLLSMSATFAKEGDKAKPQILFHVGRIVSFFVLGGTIGALGSAFTLSTSATFAMSLLIGIVMLILGINLLDVFNFVKKLQPSMPKFIARRAHNQANKLTKFNHNITPLFVGIVTFFLPCGFTQSMQLYALTTGSFMKGGLSMLAFALGTFPLLALVSFSSFSIKDSSKAGIFFKSAGLVVIMFALFNIINSLVVVGVISPIFNF